MLANEVRNRTLILQALTVGFLLLFSSCTKSGVNDPSSPFSGISLSDSTGKFSSSDPDDWKPISAIGMWFDPPGAYPNPCRAGAGFMLEYHLIRADSVLITLNDSPTHIVETIGTWKNDSGSYAMADQMTSLQPGIYRVYFKVIRPDSTYVTYGDVQVTN